MADISLEAVAGKLNRVGYEALFKALRQAKGAGNRHVELAHWLTHIMQAERSDITLTADHFKLDRQCGLLSCRDDLRAVFEMHGVVMVPLATPNEAVLLENIDNLPWNLVFIRKTAIDIGLRP